MNARHAARSASHVTHARSQPLLPLCPPPAFFSPALRGAGAPDELPGRSEAAAAHREQGSWGGICAPGRAQGERCLLNCWTRKPHSCSPLDSSRSRSCLLAPSSQITGVAGCKFAGSAVARRHCVRQPAGRDSAGCCVNVSFHHLVSLGRALRFRSGLWSHRFDLVCTPTLNWWSHSSQRRRLRMTICLRPTLHPANSLPPPRTVCFALRACVRCVAHAGVRVRQWLV